jgi:serine/threonine protein kinase
MPHIKVCDVGLARWLADNMEEQDPDSPKCKKGQMTPLDDVICDWRAPEMLTGMYGFPVDIFAYGFLLVEVMTWTVGWHDMMSQFAGAATAPQIARVAMACFRDASHRPQIVDLLQTVVSWSLEEAKQFVELWELQLSAGRNTV